MNVLVLGGTGFVGKAIANYLIKNSNLTITIGARRKQSIEGVNFCQFDATDPVSLRDAFTNIDAVVNCVTGSGSTIEKNANAIVIAAKSARRQIRIIHMSSMAVYGNRQGLLDETTTLPEEAGWYGNAKAKAERIFQQYAKESGSSIIFRIGCVFGENSALWVDRIGLLIKSGRLGDLGTLGDGWSNLVHVQDIAKAVRLSLTGQGHGSSIYNLCAPDSPRWNCFFRDFALAINSVPLKYKTRASMLMESLIVAPPVKALERLSNKGWLKAPDIQTIPPSLLRLWEQQIKLDSSKIHGELQLPWTRYVDGLNDSVSYFRSRYDG